MDWSSPAEVREYMRAWREANRERSNGYHRKRRAEKPEAVKTYFLGYQRAYRTAKPEKMREYKRAAHALLRAEVLTAYGARCACCGETETKFLGIDHIHGGGRQHRLELKFKSGSDFYRFLKKNGFPKNNYQVLCHNCNQAKGLYGQCPHAMERAHAN